MRVNVFQIAVKSPFANIRLTGVISWQKPETGF